MWHVNQVPSLCDLSRCVLSCLWQAKHKTFWTVSTKDNINRINKTLAKAKRYGFCSKLYTFNELLEHCCFHEWHFLTTACTICLNQIHPRLKWLYGPVVTRSSCQGFILIWLRSLLFLDCSMVLFSFYVEVFVENACVCFRLIEPTYVVVLFIWLFAVFTVICCWLIIAFVDVNKTYLILSYMSTALHQCQHDATVECLS